MFVNKLSNLFISCLSGLLAFGVKITAVKSVHRRSFFNSAFARYSHFPLKFVQVKKLNKASRSYNDFPTVPAIAWNLF